MRVLAIPGDFEILFLTLMRSIVVASLGVLLSFCSLGFYEGLRSERLKRWCLACVVLPVLMPDVFLGYAYKSMSDYTVHDLRLRELAYDLLLLGRYGGIGFLVFWLMPRGGVTESSLFLIKQGGAKWRDRFRLWLKSWYGASVLGWLLIFMMCFHESQVSSLLIVKGYSRLIFERVQKADYLSSWPLIWAVLVPSVMMLIAIGVTLWATLFKRQNYKSESIDLRIRHGAVRWCGASFIVFCLCMTAVYPIYEISGYLDWQRYEQMRLSSLGLGEFGVNTLLALISAMLAMLAVYIVYPSEGAVLGGRGKRGLSFGVCLLLILPGVLGALVVSLVMQWAVNLSWLRGLRETGIPLVIVMTLLLLPYALLFHGLCANVAKHSGVYLGQMQVEHSKGVSRKTVGGLLWRYRGRPYFYSFLVLFYLGYFEITAGYLLMPVTMQLKSVTLYNRMHNNQTAMLSLELYMVLLLPLLIFGVLMSLPWWRLYAGKRAR